MKRHLATLLLLPLIVVGLVSTTQASAAPPGIRSTAEYQRLKAYVGVLRSKQDNPATSDRKDTYRSRLGVKGAKAQKKVDQLQLARIAGIKATNQRKLNNTVNRLRAQEAQKIRNIKLAQQSRMNALRANQRDAVGNIRQATSMQTKPMERQRTRLKAKLQRVPNPDTKAEIRAEISDLTDQIQEFNANKNDRIAALRLKYNKQKVQVKANFAKKIDNQEHASDQAVRAAQRALKQDLHNRLSNANQRKLYESGLVNDQWNSGSAFIDEMPDK